MWALAQWHKDEDVCREGSDAGKHPANLVFRAPPLQTGCYLARALSYEGVTFEHVHVKISDDFRTMYDGAVDLWLKTFSLLSAWANISPELDRKASSPKTAKALFAFWDYGVGLLSRKKTSGAHNQGRSKSHTLAESLESLLGSEILSLLLHN